VAQEDDPAEAAARLEQALERIAHLAASRAQAGGHPAAGHPAEPDTAEIAGRLDALIGQLRSALHQEE
jgi:hypothetical protein